MTDEQWAVLKAAARGEPLPRVPTALIVDTPWIPPFLGISTVDYISIPEVWLRANLAVARRFPDLILLPGFWVEPGMAAEPSGFGCRIEFSADQPPGIRPAFADVAQAADITPPNPRRDGLMPLALSLYRHVRPLVRAEGMDIRMVAARGPLAVAAHLLGVSNFLIGLKTEPAATHRLLSVTTRLVRDWLSAQAEALPGVDGILVLDDVVGFLSREDYLEFAHPCLQEVFSLPASVKMFHDDTDSTVCYEFLHRVGINVFNFTHMKAIPDVRARVGDRVCLLGNVAPRDILAGADPSTVTENARRCIRENAGHPAFILSAGGGTSPGTPAGNIDALREAAAATAGLAVPS
ncbi:MAG TPA: uroporphyrinogen decarboxylase family protein [Spirochaetia bacterium]|nr:uroporphyrinogen decarboxylase family protein [Spirochaetia bacterium]